ncbi:spore coat protein GerQ [Heliophilum fasciatum]|nr:spore coat protein GerQ [Heliophilum fasciatum]MCW2277279.1 spore coat protein GerQ [Heliophilum fasciatum]
MKKEPVSLPSMPCEPGYTMPPLYPMPGMMPEETEPMPGWMPGRTPACTPEPMPGYMPGYMPGCMPGTMPGWMPGVHPGWMPGAMPGVMPGTMPGVMPGTMPGVMPGTMPGVMPGTMPGTAPQTMPEQLVPMLPPSGGLIPRTGTEAPGMLPVEQSYIENILRLNKGKLGTFYMTYEENTQWNAKVFKGIIEAAGRDHVIISCPKTGKRYLLLMVNLDYVTFDEEIAYNYPIAQLSIRP